MVSDSEGAKVGTTRRVPPDHHCWVVVPTKRMTPSPASACISPTPPSKKGESTANRFGSMVSLEKSSEKTTLLCWGTALICRLSHVVSAVSSLALAKEPNWKLTFENGKATSAPSIPSKRSLTVEPLATMDMVCRPPSSKASPSKAAMLFPPPVGTSPSSPILRL